MLIKGGYLNKVPVLYVEITRQNYPKLNRIKYAALVARQRTCYFPAYAPILGFCLRDIKALFNEPGEYQVDPSARKMIDEYKQQREEYHHTLSERAIKGLTYALKPYLHQIKSLAAIIYHPRWNLSLDPGLGKTKIIIDYLLYLKVKALILAPTSLLENWVDEFALHDPNGELKVVTFAEGYKPKRIQHYDTDGNPTTKKPESAKIGQTRWLRELSPKVDVLLIGYHSAALYKDALRSYYNYDAIILDESHRIKGFKSKNSIAARELSQKAYRRVTMSGTYLLNSPVDAWPQLDFLSPQILNQGFYQFRDNYCNFHANFRHQVVGYKNLDKLNKIINTFSTRITKEDAVDMPKRKVITRFYSLSPEQHRWYSEVLSENDLVFEDGNIEKEHKVVLLGKLAQISKGYVHLSNKKIDPCNGCPDVTTCVDNKIRPYTKQCHVYPKSPPPTKRRLKSNPGLVALVELLEDLLDTDGHKVIIWCRGVEEANMTMEQLEKNNWEYVFVTDATSTISKVKKFNTDKKVRVLVSSVAKGIGYTANSAQFSIYFSLGFSLEHYYQSRDRNYRINTPHPVWEYHIIGRNSIDEEILNAMKAKVDVVTTLIDTSTCDLCLQKVECAKVGRVKFQKGCKFKKQVSRQTVNTNNFIGE